MKWTPALLLFLMAPCAGAVEVAGIHFDEHMSVHGNDTVLNGAGLRSIFFFKAYAIGLYLPQRHGKVDEVLSDHGPKRIRIVLARELSADQLSGAIDSGLHRNLSDAEFKPLVSRFDMLKTTINAIGSTPLGSVIHLDWVPQGKDGYTELSVNGAHKGSDIPGEDFFQALLKVWLGQQVNDPRLRSSLLGIESRP